MILTRVQIIERGMLNIGYGTCGGSPKRDPMGQIIRLGAPSKLASGTKPNTRESALIA